MIQTSLLATGHADLVTCKLTYRVLVKLTTDITYDFYGERRELPW